MKPLASDYGFTLVELLVATMVMMAVMGAVLTVLSSARATFVVQQEVSDTQQRLRVGVSALTGALMSAGAGTVSPAGGPLARYLAAVRPYRVGDAASDVLAGVHHRPDMITVTSALAMPSSSSRPFLAGRRVVHIITQTFYLRGDPRNGASQLMHYDGRGTDVPVLDDVAGLAFEYFGEAQPPVVIADDEADLRASYGPPPPPPWRDDTTDAWGAGESCTFFQADGVHHARLAALSPGLAPVSLPAVMLTDGPWCPDATAEDRFDADLLRIRRVRVRLRVQASVTFRGPAGVLFRHAGRATAASRMVPDREIQFDVSPRNMNLDR
jgi:hypothetical protein